MALIEVFFPQYVAYNAHLANYTLYNRFLHNMICCHKNLVYKNELNRENVITLERNDETP